MEIKKPSRNRYQLVGKNNAEHQIDFGQIEFGLNWQQNRSTKITFAEPDSPYDSDATTYENVTPRYENGKWLLDLGIGGDQRGLASIKTTTIKNSTGDVIWTLYKKSKQEFGVHMGSPLSPAQAFAFAIAAVHHS